MSFKIQKFILLFCIFTLNLALLPKICSAAPVVSAKSAVLIENSTGYVIYSKNADEKMPMASTTKIMTALCAIENYPLWRYVCVDDRAVGVEGSSVYLSKGELLTMEELVYATMLNSGNDAATAIALAICPTLEDFAQLMNKTAKSIGVKNTNFENPSGLWEKNHYTTARDLAQITAYALENPVFSKIAQTKEKTISSISADGKRYLKNHNKLLWSYPNCIGVKTGYTKKCGRCLVSGAQRDGIALTCVTLNAPDDWNDHKKLLDYGFSRVKKRTLARAGDYAMSIKVGNDSGLCPLIFEEDVCFCSFDSGDREIALRFNVNKNPNSPLLPGKAMGTAELVIDGKSAFCTRLLSEG